MILIRSVSKDRERDANQGVDMGGSSVHDCGDEGDAAPGQSDAPEDRALVHTTPGAQSRHSQDCFAGWNTAGTWPQSSQYAPARRVACLR